MKLGDKAIDFKLSDQDGKMHSLSDHKGEWLLLYFYPRDLTPGCTVEACALRDNWSEFGKRGAAVLGVSADTAESHKKFADKHDLPFPLLADTEKKLIKAYGVWGKKKFMGREYMGINRMSFLIDPKGKIAKIYKTVKPAMHAEEVLADVDVFEAEK
ncbi:thioredoxin-dependent thiol peroxidase [bacterium]|nr:thioredoxin-dependent thiol peroxidase [bacterium]MCI0566397.1 thioredoxin-dependent thiol peroxidase [bacterium]MCI0680308.1 thioredoxin-dependent thiol peroxidase [bacterium]